MNQQIHTHTICKPAIHNANRGHQPNQDQSNNLRFRHKSLIREARAYVPVEGIKLGRADILHTGKNGLAQIEFDDGAVIELGADTRYLADLPGSRGSPPIVGPHYLLAGWLKLTVPKRQDPAQYRLDTPLVSLLLGEGVSVVHMTPAEGSLYMESGEGTILEPAGRTAARAAVRPGRFYARRNGQKGAISERLPPPFVESMPRAFRDTLPMRLAKFKGRDIAPKPGPDFTYADVEGWLKSDREIRQVLVPLWRAKAADPAFRAGLVANMRYHWEWDPIVFPEKYEPKKEEESSSARVEPAAGQ